MGLFFAWATGEGIIVWRWIKAKAPPAPGALLLASGLFVGLAIMAEYRPARPVATAFAWAVDLAILLRVVGKDPTEFQGTQVPQLVTGWPPPQIPPTQIWPGKATASPGSGSTASSGGFGAKQGSAISEAQQAGGLLPKAFQQIFGVPFRG